MSEPISYGFNERLLMSDGVESSADLRTILLKNIPGAIDVTRASEAEDRQGVDWWVTRTNGVRLGIELKVREQDFLAMKGVDDIALESYSVVERKKIGWTRDSSKKTDHVLFLWPTGRWCLIPFPHLCAVFSSRWAWWRCIHKVARQKTEEFGGYHSECIFVPRLELWAEIIRRFGGGAA